MVQVDPLDALEDLLESEEEGNGGKYAMPLGRDRIRPGPQQAQASTHGETGGG